MIRVVGVHGVGNLHAGLLPHDAAGSLAEAWSGALRSRAGNAGLDLEMAYYADLLTTEVAQGEQVLDLRTDLLRAWAEAVGAPADVAQGWLTWPAQQFIEWFARRFGLDLGMARWFVGRFLTEVDSYLNGSEALRSQVEARVIDAVVRHRPTVVIAHSLGSVVAYEALHRHPEVTVDMLVTIGSPLGMPDIVFDRLRHGTGASGRPAGVSRWINVADVGDIVAVPHPLPECFGVDTDLRESIGAFDFHRASRYLGSRTVRALVAAA